MLKAVEKDPRERYATAEAMAEDLRRFLDDEPILARRAGAPERDPAGHGVTRALRSWEEC